MYSSIVLGARRRRALPVVATSASPRRLDGGDVDLLHRHHRLERALGLAAVADDGVPVAVRLLLIVRRDLEGKGLVVLERRPAVETEIVFFGFIVV